MSLARITTQYEVTLGNLVSTQEFLSLSAASSMLPRCSRYSVSLLLDNLLWLLFTCTTFRAPLEVVLVIHHVIDKQPTERSAISRTVQDGIAKRRLLPGT